MYSLLFWSRGKKFSRSTNRHYQTQLDTEDSNLTTSEILMALDDAVFASSQLITDHANESRIINEVTDNEHTIQIDQVNSNDE